MVIIIDWQSLVGSIDHLDRIGVKFLVVAVTSTHREVSENTPYETHRMHELVQQGAIRVLVPETARRIEHVDAFRALQASPTCPILAFHAWWRGPAGAFRRRLRECHRLRCGARRR